MAGYGYGLGFTKYTNQNPPKIYGDLSPHPRSSSSPYKKLFKRIPGPMHPPVDRVAKLKAKADKDYTPPRKLQEVHELLFRPPAFGPRHDPAPWGRVDPGPLGPADTEALRHDGLLPCKAPRCSKCRHTGVPAHDLMNLTSYHCEFDKDFKPTKVCGRNFGLQQKLRKEAIREVERKIKTAGEREEKKKRATTCILMTKTEDKQDITDRTSITMNPFKQLQDDILTNGRTARELRELEKQRAQQQSNLEDAIRYYSRQPRTKMANHCKLAHWSVQRHKQNEKKVDRLIKQFQEQPKPACQLHEHKGHATQGKDTDVNTSGRLQTCSKSDTHDYNEESVVLSELKLCRRKKFPQEIPRSANAPVPKHHAHLFPEPFGRAATLTDGVHTPTKVISHLRTNILR